MHLGHVLEADPVLADQLLVHVHDDVVVLGVNGGDAPLGREDLQYLPDVAKLHHPPQTIGPDVGGEHFDRGVTRFDRLGQCAEHALRQLAVQQQMKAVVAIARTGPFALAQFDRLLQRLIGWTLYKIKQGRRAAVQCSTADLLGRRAQQVFIAAGKRDWRTAMDVRINAARNDDLIAGVDDPRGIDRPQTAGCADSRDLAAGDADIRRLRTIRHDGSAAADDQIKHRALPR